MMVKKGLLFVVSGPSGSGKTTLVSRVIGDPMLKKKVVRSISLTTRPKRSKERDKRDYFFITDKEFRERLKAKKILEWTKYISYYYATPKEYLKAQLDKGKSVILSLDVKGACAIKKAFPRNTVTVFVLPPVMEELERRIRERCRRTNKDEIGARLRLANDEVRKAAGYDYSLVNDDLASAVKELREIILSELGRNNPGRAK